MEIKKSLWFFLPDAIKEGNYTSSAAPKFFHMTLHLEPMQMQLLKWLFFC